MPVFERDITLVIPFPNPFGWREDKIIADYRYTKVLCLAGAVL
jgi:hypothetical protein